jgi:hypothetical protein
MSRHDGPDFYVPEDQRCEALVAGHRSWHWKWLRVDHRCPRRANQMRAGLAVCHIHGRSKQVRPWLKETIHA